MDEELIVTSSFLLIGTRMKFTFLSPQRSLLSLSLHFSFSPPPIYIYSVCSVIRVFLPPCFFTLVSERVIRSFVRPFFHPPPLASLWPTPAAFLAEWTAKTARRGWNGKGNGRNRESGERIRQVASGGSFAENNVRFERSCSKINLFERSLEKKNKKRETFQKWGKDDINMVLNDLETV